MEHFSRSTLESLMHRHVADIDGAISFDPITTGKFNTSFFVDAGDRRLVLRIAPPRDSVFLFYERDMMRQEPELHELILSKTSVPVAPIVAFDDSHELIERDFLIMERLPGRPLTEARGANYSRVLRQVGAHMAQVHRLTADRYGYLGSHHPMQPQPAWAEAFEIMWGNMIDDIVAVGHYDDGESRLMRALLERHIELFDRDVPASLLHMDIWHQNILVDDSSNVTGIVDWDRALWGDPEIEFAVLDYCGISEPAFWEGYGRRREDSDAARTRQIFYLLYELQKYIVIRQGRNNDPAAARRYKRQTMGIIARQLPQVF